MRGYLTQASKTAIAPRSRQALQRFRIGSRQFEVELPKPLPLDQDPPRQIKTQFYRSGLMRKVSDHRETLKLRPAHWEERVNQRRLEVSEEINACVQVADYLRPANRPGRSDGLFASADLQQLAKWTYGNFRTKQPCKPRQINYEGPEPWVYPVLAWSSSHPAESRFAKQALEYWQMGMPYSEYQQAQERGELDNEHLWSQGGELLLDPKYVRSARPVSFKRLCAADEGGYVTQLNEREWKEHLSDSRYAQE
jgi:hypothetical protein